jgi:hypothetical protein
MCAGKIGGRSGALIVSASMIHASRSLVAAVASLFLTAAPAAATVFKVPQQYPTIQGAVDAASAGDEIKVDKGKYCGATINKRLTLTSVKKGGATIIGCAGSPMFFPPLRVGFLLAGATGTGLASGTKIAGFVFDGKGISNGNLSPLAFGIYSRFNHDVTVVDDRFTGTVQAITNTAGDNWAISNNVIEDLTVFACPGFCGGGDGIVIQIASDAIGASGGATNQQNRPEANAVVDNDIQGKAPTGFDDFAMDGVLIFAADGTAVVRNKTKLVPGVNGTSPLGVGILVTNTCCDNAIEYAPGSRYTAIVLNQDHGQFGVVVEGSSGANTQGLVLFGNTGAQQIPAAAAAPSATATARTAAVAFKRTRFE